MKIVITQEMTNYLKEVIDLTLKPCLSYRHQKVHRKVVKGKVCIIKHEIIGAEIIFEEILLIFWTKVLRVLPRLNFHFLL